MKFVVRLRNGNALTAEFPARQTFTPGYSSLSELEAAITHSVYRSALPLIEPVPAGKRLVRNEETREVERVIDEPPMSSRQQATEAAREIAKQYMGTLRESR